MSESSLEMSPKEMRRLGYQVIDRLVERWTGLREDVAWNGGSRSELEALLREDAPENPTDPDVVLERTVRDVLKNAGRIDHPRFMAFVPGSPTWPGVLADLLSAGFNPFQGTWLESAGPSQVELIVTDWFRSWLGLPETGGGLFTSGGSAANLIAMVSAREHAGNPAKPAVYVSDQSHSSVERAAWIAGIPREGVRKIPVDDAFQMRFDALREQFESDRADGWSPVLICGNAGATNTGAIDPLGDLGRFARERGVWFHIDAAYGGFAVLTERGRARMAGIELADSVTLDPHKWLFQPYEAGCLIARDVKGLERAFHIMPEYLQDTELGMAQVNFADRGLQLTRRFRALKVWLSIQMLGLNAFREGVQKGIDLGLKAGAYVKASDVLEMLSPASLGVVCYRFNPQDRVLPVEELERINAGIQDDLVGSGFAMVASTRLREAYSLRLCILNYRTVWADVQGVLDRAARVGRELLEAGP